MSDFLTGSKRFLATQTLDEARHVEIFMHRPFDLGVKSDELEDVIRERANPNLVKFAELLLDKVDRKDFVAGVVGQNVILDGHRVNAAGAERRRYELDDRGFARRASCGEGDRVYCMACLTRLRVVAGQSGALAGRAEY